MFAIEIHFKDGVSQSEMIFVRRPHALLGSSDAAHVVVEDMKELDYQIRLVRDIGRRFRSKLVPVRDGVEIPEHLDGTYDGEALIEAGTVKLHITALDTDLFLREGEPPDRAGVRVLRQSCVSPSPMFPAIVIRGAVPSVISFAPDQPVYLGRSGDCIVRLDASDISARHARMGYESGEFWVEDLGSTNGTFVNNQQISGRVNIAPGTLVILGREIAVMGAVSEEQISRATRLPTAELQRPPMASRKYPVLVSLSEVARPARVVIPAGASIAIGRDPKSDMWLGAPHVSRKHIVVEMSKSGNLAVTDNSTNGTGYDAAGLLRKGDTLETTGNPRVFDFGGGITVALCFAEEQEKLYISSNGSRSSFAGAADGAGAGSGDAGKPSSGRFQSTVLPMRERGDRARRTGLLARTAVFYRSGGLGTRFLFLVFVTWIVVMLFVFATLLGQRFL